MMTSSETSPLVSIVTPAHNAAGHFAETLASVQAQTHPNWEWLIVDDGSTDKTRSIVEAAAASDSRIRLLEVPGAGGLAARARNTALAASRGEFLAFLDADDLWLPDKLEAQLAYLRDHPAADGVTCWFDVFGAPERLRYDSRVMRRSPVYGRSDIRSGPPEFQTSTLLMRRGVYDTIGGMDEDPRLRCGQDSEYFVRIVSHFSIHRLTRTLSRYRLSAVGDSLATFHPTGDNARGWSVFTVLTEKGVLSEDERRRWQSYLYYAQARDNLYHRNAPFRGALARSILAGRPPLRAVVMSALCFLPAFILRPLLLWPQRRLAAAARRGIADSGAAALG